MNTFNIEVKEFKRIEDPYDRGFIPGTKEKNQKIKYVGIWHIDQTPVGIPMSTNPREQKLTSQVAKDIEESLRSNDGNFYLKNRGLVISAKSVSFNNKTNIMTLIMENDYEHGNIDGGHTYKIALNNKDTGLNQYIPFEIMVNVEDIIEELAESRNTSTQVDAKSLAELSQKFEPIKEAIEGMPFYERIAFKQNQQIKGERMIDAREIVAVLSMFDVDTYSETNHPTQAYSSKAKILENYLADPDHYAKFSNIAIDIFDLFDEIEYEFPFAYNKSDGRYGAKSFSGYQVDRNGKQKEYKTKFRQRTVNYKVPDGLIYPLIASFRAAVEFDETTDKYNWKTEPLSLFEKIQTELTSKIMKFSDAIGNNPNAVGKDSNAWDILYMTVERNIK